MEYRRLGKTNLMVSEIGLGGEWLERHTTEEVKAVIDRCDECGINILDCWMPNPKVRSDIGKALRGRRDRWYIQGHLGATWKDGQYYRTRDLNLVKPAFQNLLDCMETDYMDLGMIHFVDDVDEYNDIMNGEFLAYAKELMAAGTIRHLGLSTHSPIVAEMAAKSGIIEMILFSLNPAYDCLPPTASQDDLFQPDFDGSLGGIDPERARLYALCEELDVGITVMKGFAGGRLLKAEASPFGVALTPVQLIHYALTRPAVASFLAGYDTVAHVDEAVHYETATSDEKDYASVLAGASRHTYGAQCTYCGHCRPCPMNIDIAMVNKYYDLAMMQPEVPESVREHYRALDANASDCIGCGACEERCPFKVKITERMQKAAELFK